MMDFENNRILIVDDNPAIHADFKRILGTPRSSDLDRATAELFGEDLASRSEAVYELQYASQGAEAVELVSRGFAGEQPIAVAFVDMRMPPGIDGVETIDRIWKIDSNVQIVICTAYSDQTWNQIVGRLGHTDQFLILKKPFEAAEVAQLASSLTRKWSLKRSSDTQMATLARLIEQRSQQLSTSGTLHATKPAIQAA